MLGNVRIKMFKRKFSFYCKTSILKWALFLYSMTIIVKKSEMYKVVSILVLFHLLKIRSMHIANFICITKLCVRIRKRFIKYHLLWKYVLFTKYTLTYFFPFFSFFQIQSIFQITHYKIKYILRNFQSVYSFLY